MLERKATTVIPNPNTNKMNNEYSLLASSALSALEIEHIYNEFQECGLAPVDFCKLILIKYEKTNYNQASKL